MIITCLGDSLTEGDYGVFGKSGIPNRKPENYPYFLGQLLECEVRNFGKCGYRASDYLHFYQDGHVSAKGSSIILLMLGTNGGVHPKDDNSPENSALRALINACRADVPEATIVLCTPPHATENPFYSNCGYALQVRDAVEYVRVLAEKENLPLIDVASCPDFTAESEAVMQPNDGLHFGLEGYRVLAMFIAEGLKGLGLLHT